jgi:transposase
MTRTRVKLSDKDRAVLTSWVRGRTTPRRLVERAQIVLGTADGLTPTEVSRSVGVTRATVYKWLERFAVGGVDAIEKDAPGRGRKPSIASATVSAVVERALRERPKAATHWSTRTMAKATGISPATVGRIWRAKGIKPHLVRTFKLSTDKHFLGKFLDVVGLYLDPPSGALLLSLDEKSQVQALDRTQPGLPIKRGRCGTMTHDYKRHGTTTLFAALDCFSGKVIGQCSRRHRHQEFLAFMRHVDEHTDPELEIHVILDNYGTHKHPAVRRWLKRHPRFHFHFVPTGCSWLNLVERFFRDLTDKRIRRGSFNSVPALVSAIEEYIANHNEVGEPFVWTAKAQDILEKMVRAQRALEAEQAARPRV